MPPFLLFHQKFYFCMVWDVSSVFKYSAMSLALDDAGSIFESGIQHHIDHTPSFGRRFCSVLIAINISAQFLVSILLYMTTGICIFDRRGFFYGCFCSCNAMLSVNYLCHSGFISKDIESSVARKSSLTQFNIMAAGRSPPFRRCPFIPLFLLFFLRLVFFERLQLHRRLL